ncbi:hypothetical protein QL093DRAFT_2570667 [Fusarium oxysporum]|nr:hypothetical protein QL093DRAFT_2570667 [Fusarium oxysporum]
MTELGTCIYFKSYGVPVSTHLRNRHKYMASAARHQRVFRDDQKIQQHYATQHIWTNPQGRGRPRIHDAHARSQKPWIEGVMCQRFFRSRAASGWFEVGRKLAGRGYTLRLNGTIITKQPMHSSKVSPETRAHIGEVLKREKMYRAAETQPRFYSKALGDDSFAMARLPKISLLGTDYILGQGLSEGDPDIIIPRKDEETITCFLSAVAAMLDRCELTAQNTSRVLLCRVASSRLDICQAKPFVLKVEPNTRKRYRLSWKRFIAFTLRAYLLPDVFREQEVNIRLDARIASQQYINITRLSWPRPHRLDHRLDISQQYNYKNMDTNLFRCYESLYSNDTDSISGEGSSNDYEDSKEGDGDFEESEREDSLDGWMSDTDSRDAPDVSPFRRDLGHESTNRIALIAYHGNFIDGQPGSALLVYFSGLLGFSSDCRRFQLARKYCPNLSGLIWVQRLLFLEYALPLYSYPKS